MNTPIPEKAGSCMEVRLNSPRGKFEITNMGTIKSILLKRTFLVLAFSEEEKGKLTVTQLKF